MRNSETFLQRNIEINIFFFLFNYNSTEEWAKNFIVVKNKTVFRIEKKTFFFVEEEKRIKKTFNSRQARNPKLILRRWRWFTWSLTNFRWISAWLKNISSVHEMSFFSVNHRAIHLITVCKKIFNCPQIPFTASGFLSIRFHQKKPDFWWDLSWWRNRRNEKKNKSKHNEKCWL